MKRAAIVVLLATFAAPAGAIPLYDTNEDLAGLKGIHPDSSAARVQWVSESPATFAAACDSALVLGGLDDPADAAFLEDALDLYLEATGDSLLHRDRAFLDGVPDSTADRWLAGVSADAAGTELRNAGDYAGSAESFEAAAAIYRGVGHLRREAVAWGSAGVSWWYTGDFTNVKRAYAEALDARERLGDPVLIGRTLNGLGSANFATGDLDEALRWYGRAREVRETLPDRVDLGVTVGYMGNVQLRLGRIDEARESYRQALDILGPDAPARRRTEVMVNLATVHSALGEFREAVDIFREHLALAEASGDVALEAQIRSNMGNDLGLLGEYDEALDQLERAAAIQAEHDPASLPATHLAMGGVYLSLGDLPGALGVYRQARDAAGAAENPVLVQDASLRMAAVYARMGRTDRALSTTAEVRQEYVDMEAEQELIKVALQEGSIHVEAGQFEPGAEAYREALQRNAEVGNRLVRVQALIGLGGALSGGGRLDDARTALREALAVSREIDYDTGEWSAYLNLADTFEQEGALDSARVYNDRAIAAAERARALGLGEQGQAAGVAQRAFMVEAQVHVLAKMDARDPGAGYAAEAFAVAERGKARALLDRLAEADVDLTAGDPELAAELDDTRRRLSAVGYQIREATLAGADRDSLRTLTRRRSALEDERDDLVRRQRLANPRLASLDPQGPMDVDAVRERLLDEGDVLLAYSLGDSASYLWVVDRDDLRMTVLPPRDEIEPVLDRLRAVLIDPSSDPADLADEAALLYEQLLAPAADAVAGADHIYLIPDGPLHFLPFDVLSDGPGRPLLGRPVAYGPSASTLAVLAGYGNRDAARSILVVADPAFGEEAGMGELAPLPLTRVEAESIAETFSGDEATVLLGEDAGEANLRGVLGDYRILHFATHALVDERRPERSAIALARPRDATEDGFLRAEEIYGLDLAADLVVLSACETGLGKQFRGEGVLGLPRAFFFAGSPRVVVSLWSVSDASTARLMASFYRYLRSESEDPAAALARAKAELAADPEFAHPFYWAPFGLMGPLHQR